MAPRKGERFVGFEQRARSRARERRRRVFVFLLEAIGLTFLIGAVPPLRGMWVLSAVLVGLFGAYCVLLVWLKEAERQGRPPVGTVLVKPLVARPYSGNLTTHAVPRDTGLPAIRPVAPGRVVIDEDDLVHVVVHAGRERQPAAV